MHNGVMNMDEIRIGVIGFGFMGKTHTYAYKTIPLYYGNLPFRINLAGVYNPTRAAALKAVDELGYGRAADSPGELINGEDIDAIDICSPNIYHKDAVIQAIRNGKHVYCEKPLAADYAEAREILAVSEKSGVTTQMALQYRCFPATIRAKELVDAGAIGNLMSFRCHYLHSGSVDPDKPITWKLDKRFGGGGVLLDLGPHALDLMYFLLGEYESVFAETKVIYSRRPDKNGSMVAIEAEDLAILLVKMKYGGTGIIEASKIATGANDELRFEIHGDKGAIRFNLLNPNILEYYDNTAPDQPLGGTKGFMQIDCIQKYREPGSAFPGPKYTAGWIRAHVHSLYNFLDCVYNKKQGSPSFKDGAYIQYVMEKAYESDAAKKWVIL